MRVALTRLGSTVAGAVLTLSLVVTPARGQTSDHPGLMRAIAAYEGGDMNRALALLDSLPVELPLRDQAIRHLYRGLIHFTSGDPGSALQSFAAAIEVEPTMRLDPAIHSPSRVRVYLLALDSVVQSWRGEAREAETAGNLEEASRTWQRIAQAMPSDTIAAQRYAAIQNTLTPRAAEPAQTRQARAEPPPTRQPPVIADSTPAAPVRTLDPGQAAVLGLVLPGLGEIYTGRVGRGVLVLGGAAAALGVGLLYENVAVECLTVPINNFCPPDDVVSERTERPYLGAGLAAAAALTIFGAVDAYFAARRANVRASTTETSAPQGLRLESPSVEASPSDVRLALIRLRF